MENASLSRGFIGSVCNLQKYNIAWVLIYTHYIQCGGTRLCISSSLLCEPVSLRVAIATSCDADSSRNRQDLIHSKGWIKMCTILRGRLHFVYDVTLFFPFIHQLQVTVLFLTNETKKITCVLPENACCTVYVKIRSQGCPILIYFLSAPVHLKIIELWQPVNIHV